MAAPDKPHDQPMTLAEHLALTAFLTAKGLPSALVAQALGATPGTKTRLQHSRDLIAVLKSYNVPQKEIDELVGIIATTKKDIVEAPK